MIFCNDQRVGRLGGWQKSFAYRRQRQSSICSIYHWVNHLHTLGASIEDTERHPEIFTDRVRHQEDGKWLLP
jgi:hypothetical protein